MFVVLEAMSRSLKLYIIYEKGDKQWTQKFYPMRTKEGMFLTWGPWFDTTTKSTERFHNLQTLKIMKLKEYMANIHLNRQLTKDEYPPVKNT